MVDAVVQILLHGDVGLDIIQIILVEGFAAVNTNIQIEAGVFRRPAREKSPEHHPRSHRDQSRGENQGNDGHERSHSGQLGGKGSKHQQVLPPVFPGWPLVEKGGYAGGEAEEEAEQGYNDASRPDDAKDGPSRHQQTGPGHTQHNGNGENPAAHGSRLKDHSFVSPVNIEQVVDLGLADVSAAAAKGKKVDQDKIEDRQPQSGEGKAEREGVGQAEQGQHNGAKRLVEQPAQNGAQRQGAAAHGQIFQKEQPGHLSILQSYKQVGPQLPAPAQEHEFGGVGHQPSKDTHHYHTGQHDHQGKG